MERILVVPEEILICGDFSFKVNRSDDNEAIQFLEYLNSLDLIQYVQEPTHILGNTLDLVITRNSSALIENVKVDTHMSDHMSILCDFHLKKSPVPKKEIIFRKLNYSHGYRNIQAGYKKQSMWNPVRVSLCCTGKIIQLSSQRTSR